MQGLTFVLTDPFDPSSIPLAARGIASCTFEASPAWRGILKQFPLKERWLDGNGFRLYYWTHPLYRSAISTPFRDRLALVWDGAALPSEFDFTSLAVQTGCTNLVVKDVGALTAELLDDQSGMFSDYINCEVRLDGNIASRLRHSARKNFRKAWEDFDLTIEVNPEGVFENFYDMYLRTRHRLGILPYPKSFFRALFGLREDAVVIFACRSPEGPLGYLLCYMHGHEMISGHLTYIFEQRRKRISDFMFVSAFQWGQNNGFSIFRFGADNSNQVSLIQSKQKLGAIARPQWDFHLQQRSKSNDCPNSPVRRMIRSTPHSLFRSTGRLTSLYFG